jgi:hypothetical protein
LVEGQILKPSVVEHSCDPSTLQSHHWVAEEDHKTETSQDYLGRPSIKKRKSKKEEEK